MPVNVLFLAGICGQQTGGFGDPVTKGKRLYLRLVFDKAYPLNQGLIGMADNGGRSELGNHPAEFYTANGTQDPGTLPGSSIQDITGQGWVLQKAWDKDPNPCKAFQFERPGQYNQVLVVWDGFEGYNNDRWNRLEIFGVEETEKISHAPKP